MLTPLKMQASMPGQGRTQIVFHCSFDILPEHLGQEPVNVVIDRQDARGWHLLHERKDECLIYQMDHEPNTICIWALTREAAERIFQDLGVSESAVLWRREPNE